MDENGNVLAVLDAEIAQETEGDFVFPRGRRLTKVREAVAALIAASEQASATLGHAYHTTLTGALAEYAHTDYQRLDAALANCGASV